PYASEYTSRRAYQMLAETLENDGIDFGYKVRPKDHFWHFKNALETERFDGIARALQTRTEELLTGWFANAARKFGMRDVAFAGGVALNVKANKLITELDEIDSLFVGPGANDESLSLGAAFQHLVLQSSAANAPIGDLAPFPGAYLGDAFDDD